MKFKNIQNNKWDDFKIDLKSIKSPIYNDKYLIDYAIINYNLEIINKILTIDENNLLNLNQDIFINIVKLGKYIFILDLLKIVNDKTKIYILQPIYSDDSDWIIFYFLFNSDYNCIKKILKYNKFINWDTVINGNYCLKIFLLKNYTNESEDSYKILKYIVKYTNFKKLEEENYSIIIDACLTGFNKKILDKIIKTHNSTINFINSKQLSPLICAINIKNNQLIDYLLENRCNYNYNTYTSALICSILNSDDKTTKKLLSYNDLDLNNFDSNKWLPAHHIFNKTKISIDLKRDIILKTDNLNMQNINGNTVIHLMLLNDNWRDYSDILEKKIIDIYCKNKLNLNPIDYLLINLEKNNNLYNYESEIDKLLEIVASSFLFNLNNITISNKKINIKENKIKKLYSLGFECLKKETSKCIGNIASKIKELKKSYIDDSTNKINFINETKVDYNLFISRDIDSFIYLLYFLKKYNIGILKANNVTINTSKKNIENIINFYLEISDKYTNLKGLHIIWHDKNNNVFPNFDFLHNIKNNIIFFLVTIVNPDIDHANCLIIDKLNQRIIHFEPYGQLNKINLKDFDNKCIEIFSNIFPNFKYFRPDDFMTPNSFQMLSNETNPLEKKTGDIGGFCLAWVLWFLELYLRNTKIDLKVLVNSSIAKIINSKYSFIEYIRFYANKLRRFHIKYLKKIKYPAEKIFNIYTTNDEKNYIYNSINNNIEKFLS